MRYQDLTERRAVMADLPCILGLLIQDELGRARELVAEVPAPAYIEALKKILEDRNHYLMVVEGDGEVIATCHLTLIPSLTFKGATRLQIEAVRVAAEHRGQGIGQWMMRAAKDYGRRGGAKIIQLTTNKSRAGARRFYERLGFQATHEGMKLYIED